MRITALSPALGALIENFDPRAANPADWDMLRSTLFESHHLILLRGLDLTDEEHLSFCAQFGKLGLVGQDNSSTFSYISNVRPDGILGSIAASWHFDYAFTAKPLEAISLYGLDIPASGSQTWFANAHKAADDLSDAMLRKLARLEVRNAIDVTAPEKETGVRVRMKRLDESYPHHVRPVLWRHWRTGAPLLSVNEQQSDAILGLPETESASLLEELFAHLYRPDHVYAHEWRKGDLILWDNQALHHSRPDVGVEEARTLRRISIGESPDLSMFAADRYR